MESSQKYNLDVIREQLKSTNPLFNRQYNFYNLKQQQKQTASDYLATLSSAEKAAEVRGQTLEDNLVERFLYGQQTKS